VHGWIGGVGRRRRLHASAPGSKARKDEERLLARRVGRYIAVSDDIAEHLSGTLGWPRHKIDVIHNGVALDRFRRPAERARRLQLLFEGPSLSVLEAMAGGKPIVATAIRGTDELLVDGESGLLVRPRELKARDGRDGEIG
jgi:glycosyltransferase involved in cell wall biosynthesis